MNFLLQKELDKIENSNMWIDKSLFTENQSTNKIIGYIYKITKRSTGEFYIGETTYVPIFRWGQHLLTERFNIDNIKDYIFEVIDIVYEGTIRATDLNENIIDEVTHYMMQM